MVAFRNYLLNETFEHLSMLKCYSWFYLGLAFYFIFIH